MHLSQLARRLAARVRTAAHAVGRSHGRRLAVAAVGVAALVAAGAVVLAGRTAGGAAQPTQAAALGTATVERRTLRATTSVDGTLGYADPATILNAVATSGTGDPAAAAASAVSAQAQLSTATDALAALEHPTADAVAQARAQLAQAQAALQSAEQAAAGATPAQVAAAQQQVAQAEATLRQAQDAVDGPSASALAQAQAAVAQAQTTLDGAEQQARVALSSLIAAQSGYCKSINTPDICAGDLTAALSATAVAELNTLLTGAASSPIADFATLVTTLLKASATYANAQSSLTSAQSGLASAKATLDALTSGPTSAQQAQLASAQAGAQAARAALAALVYPDQVDPAGVNTAQQQVTSARAQVDAAQATLDALLHPSTSALRQAQDAAATARAQLDAATRKATEPRGIVTQLAAEGAVVPPGGTLYTLDGVHPAVLMTGAVPAWRTLAAGVSDGPDVGQLERDLRALGYAPPGMTVNNHWDAQTTAAVEAWQRALGAPVTGTVPLGTVVFEPGPVRVTTQVASVGDTVTDGAPVLDVTSTDRVIDVALDTSLQGDVRVGDPVQVELPGGAPTTGKVATVGTVATAPSTTSPTGTGPCTNSAGASNTCTVDVTITLDRPAAAGSLDGAPVTVDITTGTAANVLAVPVTALVELLEGGYAVQVAAPGGATHYIGVQLGIFAGGWVQVSGAGLGAGQTVVVAQ